jgi:dipeptidyl aminopeptidase/acylaminoacyl peptidase
VTAINDVTPARSEHPEHRARWWVGTDEHGGIPNPGRPDVAPPAVWRLEMVAATQRVRHASVSPDGRTVAFVIDDDCSDVWTVSVDGGEAVRVTTGRPLAAYWEDGGASWSPDGALLAYVRDGHVHVVAPDGSGDRSVCEGSSPEWVDDRRLLIGVDKGEATALAVVAIDDAWPARVAQFAGECLGVSVSPDRRQVAHLLFHHDDLNCTSVHLAPVVPAEPVAPADAAGDRAVGRVVVHEPGINARCVTWSPDGSTLAFASESPGWYEVFLAAVGGDEISPVQLTRADADFGEFRFNRDGTALIGVRSKRGVADLVRISIPTGEVDVLAEGGTWSSPTELVDGSIVAVHEAFGRPSRLCRVMPDGTVRTLVDRAPAVVRSAPHVVPEHVSYLASDGFEVHGWLYRPPNASPGRPCPAVVQPHGGPTSLTGDEWDGVAQYFVDKGYAWFAINFRGSTSYGRDFERANHGVWGVADTDDCLSAHDHLASLGWVDPTRIAIFGASYGSYMALHSVVDDPQHRYAAAVMKYGDCDILTSWAQGDLVGRLDLQRMMGHPRDHRAAYAAGSPIHRIEQLRAPVLVAHGELDRRVSVRQSQELVDALRKLGRQYEYVTYPTEGHGLLRTEPFLDFHRRLERFLDWYLMV